MNTVFVRFAALISGGLGVPESEITPERTFADLELDSIALVELILAVEDEFGVKIADDALSDRDDLAHAVELITMALNDAPVDNSVTSGGAP